MELLFVFAQRRFRIGGMTFFDGEESQGNLGLCRGLFLTGLVSSGQATLRTTCERLQGRLDP